MLDKTVNHIVRRVRKHLDLSLSLMRAVARVPDPDKAKVRATYVAFVLIPFLYGTALSRTCFRGDAAIKSTLDLLALAIPRTARDEIVGDFLEALNIARNRGRWAFWLVLVMKLYVTTRAIVGIRYADLVSSRKNTQA